MTPADKIPFDIPHREYAFTVNIQSDGKISLTIRNDDEAELERLLEKWEPRVCVSVDRPRTKANNNGTKNGDRNDDRNDEKPRYYAGDSCPKCSNKLVKRRGSKGAFIGCNGYPECTFIQGL